MLNRNNIIVVLLIALWIGGWAVQTDRVELPWLAKRANQASIVWSLSADPVPTHLQAELRDMGSDTLSVQFIEESSAATDAEENAAMQTVIQAGRDAGLPAFVLSRDTTIVKVVGRIETAASLKELK